MLNLAVRSIFLGYFLHAVKFYDMGRPALLHIRAADFCHPKKSIAF
jgi:hypothetical protein